MLAATKTVFSIKHAEVVLAGSTGDHSRIPDGVSAWLNRKFGFVRKHSIVFEPEDVSRSIAAVSKVLESSELKELWEETDGFQK